MQASRLSAIFLLALSFALLSSACARESNSRALRTVRMAPGSPPTLEPGTAVAALTEDMRAAGFDVSLNALPSVEPTAGLGFESAYRTVIVDQSVDVFVLQTRSEMDAALNRLRELGERSSREGPSLDDAGTQFSVYYYRSDDMIVRCLIRGQHPVSGSDRELIGELERLLGPSVSVSTLPPKLYGR